LDKPKKVHIETFIFAPNLLSKEKKVEIEQWLLNSNELHAEADWYTAFKNEIRFVQKSKSKKRPKSSNIELLPAPVVSRRKHSFTLAAKTPAPGKRMAGIQTLRTFISEENKALVRVIRDHDENSVQIHAISEHIDADDIAMLRVSGVTNLMISKPGGIFMLKSGQYSDEMVKKWDSCLLSIPMDRADLLLSSNSGRVFLDTHRSDKEQLSVSITEEENLIKIHLTCNKGFRVEKVVVSDGKKGYLLLIHDNVIDLPKSLINNRLTSLFFFN